MRILGMAALAAALIAPAAQAAVFTGLPDGPGDPWGKIEFAGTAITHHGSYSTLQTTTNAGVYFGSYPGSGPAIGAWNVGNYLSLDARVNSGSDWEAYIYDGSYSAYIGIAPTDCYCYSEPGLSGINLDFDNSVAPAGKLFVALNPYARHTYEFLLKDGIVTYRIDGVAYSGAARTLSYSQYLIIGDGSGSTPSGTGSMNVYSATFDNAPSFSSLATAVPEPGTWAMMIGGFGLAGAMLRRRRKESVAVTA